MENLLQLQNGHKAYGSKLLFDGASFSVNSDEHVGVIGPNGAGKTTLFKILAGVEELDSGELIRSRSLRLGYLTQHEDWDLTDTVEAYLERDSVLPIWETKQQGLRLGLAEEHYSRAIGSFSGGYRMRVRLLKLLAQAPNFLLLDEPTNYLDLETVLVLERFLQGYEGAFLLISHDREFLKRTCEQTLEVEGGDIQKYPGNIEEYFGYKAQLRAQLEAEAMSIERKRKAIQDFVARFGAKATKASQAQSRLKTLAKLETIELSPLPVTSRIHIQSPERNPKLLLRMNSVSLGYGDRTVLGGLDLQIPGGDHVAVVGLNGAGKSTFLKSIVGELKPRSGSIEHGYDVRYAYFAQHVTEALDLGATVYESLMRAAPKDATPQRILDLAGSLLFSGDAVKKPVSVLSGGERTRVALGRVLLSGASCLVLDEPTNHLDFQTVEALTVALRSFEGSLVFVSHDRSFVKRVARKILEIRDGGAWLYPGSYEEYVDWVRRNGTGERKAIAANPPSSSASSAATAVRSGSAEERERRKLLERDLRAAERKLAELEKEVLHRHQEVDALTTELASGPGIENPVKSRELTARLSAAQAALSKAESEWMEQADARERAESAMKLLGK